MLRVFKIFKQMGSSARIVTMPELLAEPELAEYVAKRQHIHDEKVSDKAVNMLLEQWVAEAQRIVE